MEKVSVYACESQPVTAEGLATVLAANGDLHLSGIAATWLVARQELRALQPDVIILDNATGYRQSAQYLAEIRLISPRSATVLWVNDLGETEMIRSLQAGARGLIRRVQPIATLCECLRAVARGQIWIEPELSGVWEEHSRRGNPSLTSREREVVTLVARGLKNREIGAELGITPGTVKVHLMHIFEKTAVKDRFELAIQSPRIMGFREEGPRNSLGERQSA